MNEDAGTVDYLREVAPACEGGAYLRAVPRPGGGTVIVMTLPLLPDTDPEDISITPPPSWRLLQTYSRIWA